MRSFFRLFRFGRKKTSTSGPPPSAQTATIMSTTGATAGVYAVAVSVSTGGAVPEDAKEKKHHVKGGVGFQNPWDSWYERGGFAIAKAMIGRRISGKGHWPDAKDCTIPVRKPDFLTTRTTPKLRATWLGHACYLVEFPGGARVLFDPVFQDRCSPFSFLGPKRFTDMPCQIEDIPIVDAVVISHNHYDHLSHPTIMKIKERHPKAHFFVPMGNKKWFHDCNIDNVTEMDWWEESELTLTPEAASSKEELPSPADTVTARIGCLPCQHTSARTPFDKAHTLWSSWSVESGGQKVWFAGDTGYRAVPELDPSEDDYSPKYNFPHCPAFAQIGSLRGPFNLGLIPIGAYDPRYIMSSMHANPFDSVNIFRDTQCKRALGMHWGTWVLTEEDVMDPPKKLKDALRAKEIPETGVFDVVDVGESREF